MLDSSTVDANKDRINREGVSDIMPPRDCCPEFFQRLHRIALTMPHHSSENFLKLSLRDENDCHGVQHKTQSRHLSDEYNESFIHGFLRLQIRQIPHTYSPI